MPESCCTPSRGDQPAVETGDPGAAQPAPVALGRGVDAGERHPIEQCAVPAQTFLMGDSDGVGYHADGETPVHPVTLEPFSIDATSVTNADFARFAEATGYATEAETFGFSAVFHLAFAGPQEAIMGQASGTPWWLGVKGADWAHPEGPDSTWQGREDHPAVHLSWNDAEAYCRWAGRALPTEAQWEAASRGGLEAKRYPWGSRFPGEKRKWRANIWQGRFPVDNTAEDGFLTTAPVRTFEPNAYGLWQTVGNVWEWCADWFDPRYYAHSPAENPAGPEHGQSRVMRGGSFLCHDSYCNRYRNAARSSNTPDSSMSNTGFRTVAPA
ncbi:formylglycine-generating enzyme family protein [Ruania suaedae]|uniref:formylglycine-generating enzyme family protein n=1 Tax=Ruania suaedae TaxID=2897774 RepID=UPI003F492B7C